MRQNTEAKWFFIFAAFCSLKVYVSNFIKLGTNRFSDWSLKIETIKVKYVKPICEKNLFTSNYWGFYQIAALEIFILKRTLNKL